MKKDQKIINHLFKIACDSDKVANARIVACIVFRNKIIAHGHNQKKSHALQDRFKKNQHAIYIHAEIDAIKNALRIISIKDLINSKLYISRAKIINDNFEFGSSKPCSGCMRAINTFGINKVIYSTEQGFDYFIF